MWLGRRKYTQVSEELIPADLKALPIGSVMPFFRDQVPEPWIELNGQEILWGEAPELHKLFENAPPEALKIWEGWGGGWAMSDEPGEGMELWTPKIEPGTAIQMLWGVKYENAPDVVLAIKADHDGPSEEV